MEFDKNLIEQSLKIWNFDVEQLEIEKIQHVPMHEWRISTKDKPLLYIENLQCCLGLYAYGNNFSFAAHINPVVFAKDEYILNENNNPLYCNRCHDLLIELLKFNDKIVEPFKIGISLGATPFPDSEKSMQLIYSGIEQVIKKMHHLGIPVVPIENIYESEFIVDASKNAIIRAKQLKH